MSKNTSINTVIKTTLMLCCLLGISTNTLADTQNPTGQQLKSSLLMKSQQLKSPGMRRNQSGSRQSLRDFTNGQKGDNKLISYCWTIQHCNETISNCYSVGGNFYPGIYDYNTGAVKEGYCRL